MKRYLAKIIAMLMLTAPLASAETPFSILGLHVDLTFAAALQRAQTLGGDCQVETLRTQRGGILAECIYRACEDDTQAECAATTGPESPPATIAIAGQSVSQVTLEAATEAARLRRVMFSYDGDTAKIAEHFLDSFGPAAVDRMSNEEQSWSRSRRMSWKAGAYRVGLLYRPNVVTLTVDPALQDPARPAAE